MKKTASFKTIFLSALILLLAACTTQPGIKVQTMQMSIPGGQNIFSENMLSGEIAETQITHTAFRGPLEQVIELKPGCIEMFLFVKGSGTLVADTAKYRLTSESIAIPMQYNKVSISVPKGEELHFLRFTKTLSEQDKADLQNFPDENKYAVYFTRFEDCEAYTEKIKSPNTVSRTVLPQDIVPRVSLGTVAAPGPDAVGAHKHPMLDQLFLGLAGNDVTVFADELSTAFPEFSLLHIPIGSSHWVEVAENKKMYYMWMDFFLTKEGQEWLKTHKPISTSKKDY